MPIPSGYSRSTFYGYLPGGEIFNFSLWANEAPADQAATQAQANAFATELVVAQTAGQTPPWNLMTTDSGFSGVRVYSYATGTGKATYIADQTAAKPGTQLSPAILPNQCALVVTLKSATAGRSNQGRIYLPLTNTTLQTGGQVANTVASGVANWTANFISRLNSHIGTQRIGILSQKYGHFQPITTCTCDTRIDIQRRRANKLIPVSRTTSPVV